MYTKGTKTKKTHDTTHSLSSSTATERGEHPGGNQLRKAAQKLPSDQSDPEYRRLKYVRYADDWLLGFTGPREEAEQIKQAIKTYLHEE